MTTFDRPDGFVSGLPNCGVTAIAAVTGAHYGDVWDWFRARRQRNNWKGRTQLSEYVPALNYFGHVALSFGAVGRGLTLAKFVELHTVKGETYLIRTAGHMLSVKNGIVVDNIEVASAHRHKRRRTRVKNAWLVERA